MIDKNVFHLCGCPPLNAHTDLAHLAPRILDICALEGSRDDPFQTIAIHPNVSITLLDYGVYLRLCNYGVLGHFLPCPSADISGLTHRRMKEHDRWSLFRQRVKSYI
jgi:hypothetical protein